MDIFIAQTYEKYENYILKLFFLAVVASDVCEYFSILTNNTIESSSFTYRLEC